MPSAIRRKSPLRVPSPERLPLSVKQSIALFLESIPHRNPKLFTEFLPKGYELLVLSSVDRSYRRKLLQAKIHLGMLITLYDDLADSPRYANSRLLHELYKLPFRFDSVKPLRLSARERKIVELAKLLSDQTFPILLSLPHFHRLSMLLRFDLDQFFNGNRYAELMMQLPQVANRWEGAVYTSHNMGIVLVGTMDLMASPALQLRELGTIREVLWFGQRYGRICNVLTTLDRELSEGDVTNELVMAATQDGKIACPGIEPDAEGRQVILNYAAEFEAEREDCLRQIERRSSQIQSFDVGLYCKGLLQVRLLHESLEGVI